MTSIFHGIPSQHQGALVFMRNHIDTICAEGNITEYMADSLHSAIDRYHAVNKHLSVDAFCIGLNEHISQELESSLDNASSAARFVM